MARFEEHTLEEIRSRLNIVDVIGEYVQLKKTGQGYQGLCPFHSEKSPSFHVHAEKQIFHCFGCHKGGNAFTFLMGIEGWNFPETVKKLAERTGVDLPKAKEFVPIQRSPVAVEEENRLYAANEWAAKYYNYLLMQEKDPRGLNYLKQRGLSEKTIEKFKLGISPSGWNGLILQMTKRGYTLPELVKGGLAIAKEDSPNGGYDRFRNRIMFPIHNKDGRIVGFGARLLEDDPKQPKYLNSSESALFSKRGILYGLFENQRGIRLRNEAVIVEGYMDVVGLYQAGVQNAVATMGTAFTEEHTVLLKGLTRKVVTVFDPDKAGTEASRRSVHVFLESGIFAKDLILPDGMDPDEYVLANSAESFYDLCEKAPRQVTKLLKEVAGEGPLSEEQRAHWLERLTPVLVASRRLPDRALLWDNISLVLQLSVESLRAVAEGAQARQAQGASKAPAPNHRPGGPPRPTPKPRMTSDQLMELEFFLGAVSCPEGLRQIPVGLWRMAFQDRKLARYLDALYPLDGEAFSRQLGDLLGAETDPVLLEKTSSLVFAKEGVPQTKPGELIEIALRILDQRKTAHIHSIGTQVKLAQRIGNEAEQLSLLEKLKTLRSWQPKLEDMEWLFTQLNLPPNPVLAKPPPSN